MKKETIYILIGVAVLVGVGGYIYYKNSKDDKNIDENDPATKPDVKESRKIDIKINF